MGTAGQSITLANSIIGVGILAMPFCYQQCGVLLATIILLAMGLISRLCCYFLLKSALLARRRNFEFLAFHVFGPAGKLAVELGIIGFLMGTCIAYFVVVGDLGPQIVSKMFNINQSDILRTSIMVIVSLVCVLPLGLLRNVDSLNNVSAATICFYFCLVIKVIAEAASQLLAGDWHSKMELWKPSGVLQCVPIFSMALFCQTQLFEIFESLPTLSLEKMNLVTKNAINICTAVYFTLGVFGYIAFCSHDISGNILMSLSPTMTSDVIKLGFVMSVAFSFPLIIFPCRASLYSFLYKKVHSTHHDHIINHSIPETTFRCITVAIIAVALFVSLLIPNIELVLGLVGSTIGVLICVVFPAACFVNVTFKNTNERVLAKGIVILGLVIMVLGTYANLQAAESKLDRYDDKITQERIDKIVEDFFQRMEKDDVNGKVINGNKQVLQPDIVKKEDEKDSEVQPPNPVPPNSQSNEKHEENKSVDSTNMKKPAEENLNEKIANKVINKVSESHPKNLKNKLTEAKKVNGKISKETQENAKVDKAEPSKNIDKSQENIDMMKQQKLIETIKQHGEEQKELIKEQKEILDEIIKTKKELQQNKKEMDDTEAKKIAVESIQKIANVAIKSLSGVSDSPRDNKKEPLEKIANEAVQEIAKKAVETIEAIKEVSAVNVKQESVNKETNNVNNPAQDKSEQLIQNAQPEMLKNIEQLNSDKVLNDAPIALKVLERSINVPLPDMPLSESLVQHKKEDTINNLAVQPVVNGIVNNPNPVETKKADINRSMVKHEVEKVDNTNKVGEDTKILSQMPDEPQSYKRGEDMQGANEMAKNVAENIPVPIVMKGNSKINNPQLTLIETLNEKINQNEKQINGANKDDIANPIRQKREVVDCTQTMSLGPQDKEICKTLLGPQDKQEILTSNVDLHDLGLPKHLTVVDTMIHHMRSLKSVDENTKRR